jgi:hypothetical protein
MLSIGLPMFYRLYHMAMHAISNQWFGLGARQLMAEGDPAHLGHGA